MTGDPMTRAEALEMEGSGWEGRLTDLGDGMEVEPT